jgi:Flp pilus assembly protein TadG
MRRLRGHEAEKGVSAVEMALVLPLLIVLVLGIVEAAGAFAQQNAVRGAAREAARIAATQDVDSAAIENLVCPGLHNDNAAVEASGLSNNGASPQGTFGAVGFIRVQAPYDSFTGFFPSFEGVTITSTVDFTVQYVGTSSPSWWPNGGGNGCP